MAMAQAARTAVVLFNLGGPDGPGAVRPFLLNLFSDPAIIGLPRILRWPLAYYIAGRRAGPAAKIYESLGGGSPLLANTEAQARALGEALGDDGAFRVFIAMRYWHPLSGRTAREVAAWRPDRVVLLPLYPQFSTTTTGSSLVAWWRAAAVAGIAAPTASICCYPAAAGLIDAQARLVRRALEAAGPARVLFSAHGLPKRIVARGDPYRWQVERTAAAVAEAAGLDDWVVCYQSRVGPLEWIGPTTEDEIRRAGGERAAVVVVPIAFVSEHSETLYELDVLYRGVAERAGVPGYHRVAALGVDEAFIAALAALVRGADAVEGTVSEAGGRLCAGEHGGCPRRGPEAGQGG